MNIQFKSTTYSHFIVLIDSKKEQKDMRNKSECSSLFQKPKHINMNRAMAAITGIYCSIVSSMPAYANSQTIIQGINRGTEQVWRILIAIVAPIGAVALALQVIKIIWGGARAAEEAKSAAIKIIVAIAVVLMAPAIVAAIKSWFTAASWSFS